ncbi:MAG: GMC oxidoreductase, partial [Longimicrobiales bacterium]
ARTERGTARMRAYYDVLPARESELTLDTRSRNQWGDPMPRLEFRDAQASVALRSHTEAGIRGVFERMARAGDGRVLEARTQEIHDHPGGGCRMGEEPASSVVDRTGRTHDHENLFVVGAPTIVSGGCANATLTFAALSLLATTEIGREFPGRQTAPAA